VVDKELTPDFSSIRWDPVISGYPRRRQAVSNASGLRLRGDRHASVNGGLGRVGKKLGCWADACADEGMHKHAWSVDYEGKAPGARRLQKARHWSHHAHCDIDKEYNLPGRFKMKK
jgi:hypothetical protein